MVTEMSTEIKQENRLHQYFKDQYLSHQKQWKKVDRELLYTSRLAYWTDWISLHIDYITFDLKRYNLTKDQRNELINQREELYKLKQLAFFLLLKSKYAKLKAFVPKVHRKLCNKHRRWCYKKGRNISIYDSLYTDDKEFKECPNCQKGETHFYSLYAIRIKHEDTKTFFLFHTPYLTIKDKIQKDIEDLPQLKRFIGDIGVSKFHPHPNFRKGQKPPYHVFPYELTIKQFKKNYVKLKKYFQEGTNKK